MIDEKIKKYLTEIENKKNIRILFACESGSRAWGFPSPDSDYDVRFVYQHQKEWYLGLFEENDTIESMLENNLFDINGWDLRKSLRLLIKSNVHLLEIIQSPIIYKVDYAFLSGITNIAKDTYSRIASIYHHSNLAKKFLSEIKDSEPFKLKKLFYILRSAVACKWILDRDDIPPMVLTDMLAGIDISDGLQNRISELIKLKSTVDEKYLHPKENELHHFIMSCIERTENEAKTLPGSKANMKEVNSFFLNTLTA